MQHIDNNLIASLQRALLERRGALAGAVRARLYSDGSEAATVLASSHTLADPAQADALGEDELALLHQECRQLEAVEQALGRITDGSYGLCQQCGRAVAPARLQAQPAAALCLDCQQASERHYQVQPV
jgi:DnaK suppressor protein